MFGKDAECSSVEAISLLFFFGRKRNLDVPGLCAQRSCTPLLCKLKTGQNVRLAHRPLFRAAGGQASWGSRLFKPIVSRRAGWQACAP